MSLCEIATRILCSFQHYAWLSFCAFLVATRGHGGRVVTLSPPTSEAVVQFLAQPQVGKVIVASVGRQLTVLNSDQLYVLVSSALPTTHCDMTCRVLKET